VGFPAYFINLYISLDNDKIILIRLCLEQTYSQGDNKIIIMNKKEIES